MEEKCSSWMVAKKNKVQSELIQSEEIPQRVLFTTVKLSEIAKNQLRLEADAYSIALREAQDEIKQSNLSICTVLGQNGLGESATNAFRFRRHYVEKDRGIPFLSSSDIIELRAKPINYISRKLTKKADDLLICPYDILISCSGTIGNVAFTGKALEGVALSQDAIRLKAKEPLLAGYIAAFLRSKYGKVQLTQSSYGSVITHIEPHHLENVIIPDPHPVVRANIGQTMLDAAHLRDESNNLLDQAEAVLHSSLNLPSLNHLQHELGNTPFKAVKASQLQRRFEASYHNPLVDRALDTLKKTNCRIVRLDDQALTNEIRPITKFRKRVYVEEGGIPLLSSKQIFQIDPIKVKHLAKGAHTKDLKEIALEENMLVVTRSGTIGRVGIIPAYMAGWAGSEHATRVVATNDINAGFLYTWLASEYGYLFISRHSYGSVILEIDKEMLSSVPVPLIEDTVKKEVGELVLKANSLRNEAWQKEQEAISQLEQCIKSSKII